MLFPAYNWVNTNTGEVCDLNSRENYLKHTIVATGLKEVRKALKQYLMNDINNVTRDFLNIYLYNTALLAKTEIVNDGTYRNCVILVRPDKLIESGLRRHIHSYSIFHCHNILTNYLNTAETIFLNLTTETWIDTLNKTKDFDSDHLLKL